MGGYFEALRPTTDRTPLVAGLLGAGIRGPASGVDRVQLASLSRALYDNGGFVGYAVNQIALYSAPVMPQAASGDDAWNKLAEMWFFDWAKRADFLGRPEMDFWAIQTQICQALDLDGDIGALVVTESGFPQVQLVEGWRIGSSLSTNDADVVDGVKVDAKGRVLGYVIDVDGKSQTVPVSEMMLIRDPCIVSPFRGLSPLRRSMNDIRDARDILGFEKIAVKQNSALIGVMEGGPLDEGHGFDLSGEEGQPPPDTTEGEKTLSRADLLGGDIPVLPDGKQFKRVESARPNAGFGDFLDSLVGQFAAGLDIPPAFFLDQKLTGPNQRSVNAKAQRKFDQRQAVICRLVEWLWVRVVGWAIQSGELAAVDGWWRVTFQRPARITIDAGREAQQEREDQGRGLMTRQDHYGGRGRDWQRETDQCLAEDSYIIERAKELATRSGVPLPVILARYGFDQAKVPAPVPAPDKPTSGPPA